MKTPLPEVLLVSPLFRPLHTGAGRQAEAIARLLRDDVHTRVLTLGGPQLPPSETRDGMRITRVGTSRAPRPAREFGRAAFGHLVRMRPAPDLVQVLGVGPAAYAVLMACELRRVPCLAKLTLEGEDDPVTLAGRSGGRWRLLLLQRARIIICPSRRMEALILAQGVPPARVAYIPNGVDLERFSPASFPADAGGERRVLSRMAYLGVLDERKGLEPLLRDLGPVFARHPQARLRLIGSAMPTTEGKTYLDQLHSLAAQLPADRVAFEGEHDHPEKVLAECGIFVFPSSAEGLPNALLEAMAAGLAPVASDLPALREVIQPGVNGLLIPLGDSAAWAAALDSLLSDPQRIREIGQAARATVERDYDLRVTAQRYLDLYRMVLHDTSRPGAGPVAPPSMED